MSVRLRVAQCGCPEERPNSALSSSTRSLSRSRVSWAICCASMRAPASTLGPRFCGASAARSAASRWRRQVLRDDEYTPSRRISAPTSPGLVHRSAACRMRRLSALVKVRRRARGTTSESLPDGIGDGADPGASSVALRAPCDAPGSEGTFSACMGPFDCWLIFIPTSLLTDLSGVGVAAHIGTGGPRPAQGRRGRQQPDQDRCRACVRGADRQAV
jgi:hypothetical protein